MSDAASATPTEKTSDELLVRCPCCQAELTVARSTGHVLEHSSAERPTADLDQLFAVERNSRLRAERLFEQERQGLQQQDRLLEEKFERALRRAQSEPDSTPPPRLFELD